MTLTTNKHVLAFGKVLAQALFGLKTTEDLDAHVAAAADGTKIVLANYNQDWVGDLAKKKWFTCHVIQVGDQKYLVNVSTSKKSAVKFVAVAENIKVNGAHPRVCEHLSYKLQGREVTLPAKEGLPADRVAGVAGNAHAIVTLCPLDDANVGAVPHASFACAAETVRNYFNLGCGSATATWAVEPVAPVGGAGAGAGAYEMIDDGALSVASELSDIEAATNITGLTTHSRYFFA